MGSNVVRGEVEGTIEFTGSNTFFDKRLLPYFKVMMSWVTYEKFY